MTDKTALNLDTLWLGLKAAVPAVVLANALVEALPHTRGLGFNLHLRYAVVTPVTALATVAGAFLYRRFRTTPPTRWADRSRWSRAGLIATALFGVLEAAGVVAAISSEAPAPPSTAGLPFDIPKTMFDVDHKFIDLPSGALVHYVDEGQGQTLLFLHGNPSWSFQWRDLIRELRGSYRCIALDYPGFGMSTTSAPGFGYTAREESIVVEEFAEALKLRDVTLVMQDWGGPIGIAFAERRPELVKSFVLGSTWAWPTTTAEPRGKFSAIMGGPIGEFIQMNFNGFAKLGIKNGIKHDLAPQVLDAYTRPFQPLATRGIAAFYPGEINRATDWFTEIQRGLPRVAGKKALIFWAALDRGFTQVDREKWEQALPHHEVVELPNADHFFFEDTLDVLVPKIRAFVGPVNAAR